MREFTNLKDLPKSKTQICWTNAVGYRLNFIYDEISGDIIIKNYDSITHRVYFEYCGETYSMSCSNFKQCKLGNVVGVRRTGFVYNVGDIYNEFKIIKRFKRKMKSGINQKCYTLQCIKCGAVFDRAEIHMSGRNCPCCGAIIKNVITGLNDISTTHPHMLKYFDNKKDAFTHSYGSADIVTTSCPYCGYKKEIKICNLCNHPYFCAKCSDGNSYPNKFITSILSQIGVKFETEKIFEWAKNKRYDHYIPTLNCIIENNGEQHYKESFFRCGGDSLNDIIANDKLKEETAKENGVRYYIVLDCRKSDVEWIKTSVMNSELPKLLNFKCEDIDWIVSTRDATKSNVVVVAQLWNENKYTISEISDIVSVSKDTVTKYLKQASSAGICLYDTSMSSKTDSYKLKISNLRSIPLEVTYKGNIYIFKTVTELIKKSKELFGSNFRASDIKIAYKTGLLYKNCIIKKLKLGCIDKIV